MIFFPDQMYPVGFDIIGLKISFSEAIRLVRLIWAGRDDSKGLLFVFCYSRSPVLFPLQNHRSLLCAYCVLSSEGGALYRKWCEKKRSYALTAHYRINSLGEKVFALGTHKGMHGWPQCNVSPCMKLESWCFRHCCQLVDKTVCLEGSGCAQRLVPPLEQETTVFSQRVSLPRPCCEQLSIGQMGTRDHRPFDVCLQAVLWPLHHAVSFWIINTHPKTIISTNLNYHQAEAFDFYPPFSLHV